MREFLSLLFAEAQAPLFLFLCAGVSVLSKAERVCLCMLVKQLVIFIFTRSSCGEGMEEGGGEGGFRKKKNNI